MLSPYFLPGSDASVGLLPSCLILKALPNHFLQTRAQALTFSVLLPCSVVLHSPRCSVAHRVFVEFHTAWLPVCVAFLGCQQHQRGVAEDRVFRIEALCQLGRHSMLPLVGVRRGDKFCDMGAIRGFLGKPGP